jgi:AcrR family transcriptional regulator
MRRKAHKYKTRKPVQERSQATFEAIIEATAQILERDGLAGLSTNRVARVAGVSVGSLYQYFPDKQALVEEVRSRFAARFQSRLLELVGRLPGLGLRQAIREWVVTLVDLHAESPGVHNAVGTGSPDDARAPLAGVVKGFLDAHAAEVRRPDRELAARLLIDTAESLVHNTALREPERLRDGAWVEEVCDLLHRYVLRDAAP